MESAFVILGLLMFALWGYSVSIIIRKLENTTPGEKTALITGFVLLILYMIGNSN